MRLMKNALLLFGLLLTAAPALAQAPSPRPQAPDDLVEVEPITCWWRSSATAVRSGESFTITLTCAVVETEQNKVVPDFSKLDPTVVQMPPFEVLGGTHAGDLVRPGKRFFQYDYRLRLIAEDSFGADVPVPPLEITYRIESKVAGGDTVQGRDQSYALPRASVRLLSIVPDDTTDIRETAPSQFTAIENRDSRANLMQTVAGVLFALAGVIGLVMLVGLLRKKTKSSTVSQAHLGPRTILSAVAKELDEVQRASRGGWTPELAGRALAGLRIAGTYAVGRAVGQCPVKSGDKPAEGQLRVSSFGRAPMFVSGSATAESVCGADAPHGLADALRTLTVARYGRVEKIDSNADDAVAAAIRVTKQQQSAHSWIREMGANVASKMPKVPGLSRA